FLLSFPTRRSSDLLLVALSLYLFLTDALGVSVNKMEKLQMFSPLQYVEKLLETFVSGIANHPLSIIILVAVILLGAALNLFVLHRTGREEKEDEDITEASESVNSLIHLLPHAWPAIPHGS